MDIDEVKHGDISILTPVGSLNPQGVHLFEQAVLGRLEAGGQFFIINCSKTEHLSSSGIRILVMMVKRLSGTGGRVVLCSVGQQMKTVLDIAGLTEFFQTASSVKDAIIQVYPETLLGQVSGRARALLSVGERETSSNTHISAQAHQLANQVRAIIESAETHSDPESAANSTSEDDAKPKALQQVKRSVSKMFGDIASKVRR